MDTIRKIQAQPASKTTKSTNLPPNVHRIAGTEMLYTTSGDETFTHQDAAKWAKGLPKVPGHSQWDLAEKREVVLLIDDERHNPAVNAEQHPDIGSHWYWLKPVDASSPADFAWCVYFGAGGIGRSLRGLRGRALAVCRPLPASQQ